ncbi:hypothetical protein HUN08_18080 [Gordonia sp. X0973]|uniref:hypothetical protein n=1 Tax=Gordonia sp. X0973 TaxID=2742602 RepID=UPI000F522D49|nr:hypothetical protein [Gordonia sp. X0973]QKT08905.1 hypothetical protein HUN08_18080 [Gordonia sp. X0973]
MSPPFAPPRFPPLLTVDPDRLRALSHEWRRSAAILAELSVDEMGTPSDGGACLRVAGAAGHAVRRAGVGIAERLEALGAIVDRYSASAERDDAAMAAAFAALADR